MLNLPPPSPEICAEYNLMFIGASVVMRGNHPNPKRLISEGGGGGGSK